MAGIWNINSAYDVNSKKIYKKLSFELEEKFIARIISFDEISNEAILKLLDGWEFSAKINQPKGFNKNELIKFQVDGYEDGEILLKILNNLEDSEKVTIEDTLKEKGVFLKKEDYNIIQKMIKYKMPLTKENISEIKSLLNFQAKILVDSNEENNFIIKYLDNKNVLPNSNEGQDITKILKGFFKEVKKLNTDELLTLIENSIDLTEDNIISFNKLNKEPMALYKEIKNLAENVLDKDVIILNSKDQDNKDKSNENYVKDTKNFSDDKNTKVHFSQNKEIKNNVYIQNAYSSNNKELDGKEILKKLLDINSDTEKVDVNENINVNEDNKEDATSTQLKEGINKESEQSEENYSLKKPDQVEKLIKEDNEGSLQKLKSTSQEVKQELNAKIDEMKKIIKHVLKESESGNVTNKIIQNLQGKLNDFKIFNSISNQYYYLDVPINIKNKDYQCKFMIKDERKKGKKIDSTNVKLVATVKTINMGIVDAYIKVLNYNINVDVKCKKEYIKLLNLGKKTIMKRLNDLGYIPSIDINEKQKEANLVECRSFFEDSSFKRIDTRV